MAWLWRRKPGDFDDEIRAHLELDADQLIEDGALPEEARAAARRRFGNLTAAQERFHESGRLLVADQFLQDARSAARALRRHPIVSGVAALSLALGIGSTTVSLAVRDTMFRNPPPLYEKPEQLSTVFTITPRGFRRGVPAALFTSWSARDDRHEQWAAARSPRRDDVRTGDRSDTISIRAVTPRLFALLGVQAAAGRTFDQLDGDSSTSVVISNRVWRTLFDGRADVVGQTIWIAERPHTVAGVMPARFWFDELGAVVWTALDSATIPRDENLTVIVRRPPGLTARALLTTLSPGLNAYVSALPQDQRALRAGTDGVGGTPTGRAMSLILPYLLGGCVVLTGLIACANVAVLLMAQWTNREHEISILASLGASRSRIVRLLLTESGLIALVGGVLGICATFALRGLIVRNSGPAITLFDTSIHADVLLQAVVITIVTGLLAGLAPALYETRRLHANPLTTLSSERVRQRWRHALVVAEIAATVALLVVTATIVDAYRRNLSTDFGFPTHGLSIIGVQNPFGVASAQILDLMGGVPAVTSVAAATSAPWMGTPDLRTVTLGTDDAAAVQAEPVRVSPGFFETLGVPLRAGRPFLASDQSAVASVAIVNDTLARRLLPGRDALGARIVLDRAPYTVVGVVADYRRFSLAVPPPAVYLPLASNGGGATRLQFLIRTSLAVPDQLFADLRRDVRQAGTGHSLVASIAVDQVIAVAGQELLASTYPLVPLIAIGLLLTGAGVYAVLAFAVTRRSKELALRIAIGAGTPDILRLVTAHTARLFVVGTTLGIAVTFGLSRVVRAIGGAGSFLDTPSWPAFLVPALVIAGMCVIATGIPSRRALRLDPATLLRVD